MPEPEHAIYEEIAGRICAEYDLTLRDVATERPKKSYTIYGTPICVERGKFYVAVTLENLWGYVRWRIWCEPTAAGFAEGMKRWAAEEVTTFPRDAQERRTTETSASADEP